MRNSETIYSTPIVERSGLKYRVEMRPTPFGTYQQRHIWYPAPASLVDCETADEWIDTPFKALGPTFTLAEGK